MKQAESITIELANQLWEILIAECQASTHQGQRQQFIEAMTSEDGCREYRFGGGLGFGGKIYNEHGRFRVSCYSEDLTAKRTEMIAAANERLKAVTS